jgi:hypothetical protein
MGVLPPYISQATAQRKANCFTQAACAKHTESTYSEKISVYTALERSNSFYDIFD